MKTSLHLFFLIGFVSIGLSQSDTLFLKNNKKTSCKIFEINEYEIKYRAGDLLDGPIYVIDKTTVIKYKLANGFTEMLLPDELSLEHEHKEILGNRQVIKIHPFSFAGSHIGFAYEKVIKVGMNLDIEGGYINSSITNSNNNWSSLNSYYLFNNNPMYSGLYFKPGIKFFLGQDFSVRGLKYAHPLKGRYIKLDLAVSYLNYRDLAMVYQSSPVYPGSIATRTVYSDFNTVAYGGFVNYGRQFILGNILTMDYYFGVGFTGRSNSYSNKDFFKDPFNNNNNIYYGMDRYFINPYNYHTFLRVQNLGLSFTAGFRIGYIIPDKKARPKQKNRAKKLNSLNK
jgi:hypothetical protein